MEDYFKADKRKEQADYNAVMRDQVKKRRKQKAPEGRRVTRDELSDALIDLQIRGSEIMRSGKRVNHYIVKNVPQSFSK